MAAGRTAVLGLLGHVLGLPGQTNHKFPAGRSRSEHNDTYTPDFEQDTYTKVGWRLIPFLFICYIVAFLDRVNVGFAKLQMAGDLKFSDTVYGFGAGIFFIGYFIFEVPSNVILERSARASGSRAS